MREKFTKEMRQIARERGGRCLSSAYISSQTKLLWQCSEGHQWEAVPCNVKHGTWCPYCAGNAKRRTIEEMRKIARERGGRCLSPTYRGIFEKLLWQCSVGHRWRTAPHNVKRGSWCPHCAVTARRENFLKRMRQIARKRGGKCLSSSYVNKQTKLLWQCSKGHQWKAKPANVKYGTWCPHCAGKAKGTIKEMRKIARKRGGKCLSSNYANSNTKLLWQCLKGHCWKATPHSIKSGSWCPYCASVKKGTIKEMQQIAQKRGGKCLSPTYTNTRTKLLWQCSKGHQWEARPGNVKFGQWCPICAIAGKSKKVRENRI